ncbi:MAG: lactate utilization protein [Desulfohalobiaceae bacterium]|nr:lactate utilization protein [Desulfohalobiaceae bacterium]
MTDQELVARFRERAEAVSTTVVEAENTEEALKYGLAVCRDKEACQSLASGCDLPLSGRAADLCSLKEPEKIIAAPGLDTSDLERLRELCEESRIALISGGLRARLGGIDLGLTRMEAGIAATGTLVQHCPGEDERLAGMISEVHIALLPVSAIVAESHDLTSRLRERMAAGSDSTAFITGPSRTADIERVLTLGVHGPLEVHAILLRDQ